MKVSPACRKCVIEISVLAKDNNYNLIIKPNYLFRYIYSCKASLLQHTKAQKHIIIICLTQCVHLHWVKVLRILTSLRSFYEKSHENKNCSFIKANLFCINDYHCKLTCRLAFYAQIYHSFPAGASQIAFWQICRLCV